MSNLCKYSIHSANNVDYIDDLDKVRCSLPYVGAELRALQPGVILLPERAWMYREIADAIRDASPNSKILPAKQFNARVVNLHLSKHEDAGAKFEKAYRSRPLHGWMERLHGINKNSAWRYISHLNEILDSIK